MHNNRLRAVHIKIDGGTSEEEQLARIDEINDLIKKIDEKTKT